MNGLGTEHLPALELRYEEAETRLSECVIDLHNNSGAGAIAGLEVDLYLASMQVVLINEKIEALKLKANKG